jgi:MFS family permease
VSAPSNFFSQCSLVNPAFTVLLPLGGIVGIPFVGYLLDRRTTFEATIVLIVFGLAFGILTSLPQTIPQLVGIGFLVILRPLFYTYVSDFFAKIFGYVLSLRPS